MCALANETKLCAEYHVGALPYILACLSSWSLPCPKTLGEVKMFTVLFRMNLDMVVNLNHHSENVLAICVSGWNLVNDYFYIGLYLVILLKGFELIIRMIWA